MGLAGPENGLGDITHNSIFSPTLKKIDDILDSSYQADVVSSVHVSDQFDFK